MKCQWEQWRAVIECILKSAPDQLRTVSPADPVADHHARVQVKNYTNIIVFLLDTAIDWFIHVYMVLRAIPVEEEMVGRVHRLCIVRVLRRGYQDYIFSPCFHLLS